MSARHTGSFGESFSSSLHEALEMMGCFASHLQALVVNWAKCEQILRGNMEIRVDLTKDWRLRDIGLAHAREYLSHPLRSWLSRIQSEERHVVCQKSEFLLIQLYRLLYRHFIIRAKPMSRKRQSQVQSAIRRHWWEAA